MTRAIDELIADYEKKIAQINIELKGELEYKWDIWLTAKREAYEDAVAIAKSKREKLQPYCCDLARATMGWTHNSDCENWVLTS